MSAREPWRRVFPTWSAAEAYLAERGFSVGRMQGPERRGVMLGCWDIQKWRNLTRADREALHGTMQRGAEVGSAVAVTIFGHAPAEAHEAVRRDAMVTT